MVLKAMMPNDSKSTAMESKVRQSPGKTQKCKDSEIRAITHNQ